MQTLPTPNSNALALLPLCLTQNIQDEGDILLFRVYYSKSLTAWPEWKGQSQTECYREIKSKSATSCTFSLSWEKKKSTKTKKQNPQNKRKKKKKRKKRALDGKDTNVISLFQSMPGAINKVGSLYSQFKGMTKEITCKYVHVWAILLDH